LIRSRTVAWLRRQKEKLQGLAIVFEESNQPKLFTRDVQILLFQGVRAPLVSLAKHATAKPKYSGPTWIRLNDPKV
jgi:hypothetical protein